MARDQGIDDSQLSPQQAAKVWRLIPEDLRHRFMNMLAAADEPLHDAVLELTARKDERPMSYNPLQDAEAQIARVRRQMDARREADERAKHEKQERLEREAAAVRAAQEKRADEGIERLKRQSLTAYLSKRLGTADDFEKDWPAILTKIRVDSAASGVADSDMPRPKVSF